MTRSQWENALATSELIRNVSCLVVLGALAVFMLYQLVTPAEVPPAQPSRQGGIPVVSLANVPAQGFPGIPLEALNAVMEHAHNTLASAESAAQQFVAENVSCNHGVAWVALKTRVSGIEQVSFAPLQNQRDGVTSITCSHNGYQANGQALTDLQLAMYAMDSGKQSQ
ncbi:hypothetical protein M1D58_27440 (plasmid) [Pseudomonas sp. R4-76]|uniref:hypothetical protein n=1 Tax=unclassified Pseudomonas TaxID=196821 RepID=UPI003DAA33BD